MAKVRLECEEVTARPLANDMLIPPSWKATTEVVATVPEQGVDTYSGYGYTAMHALAELVRVLADVVGYERTHDRGPHVEAPCPPG